MAYTVEYKPVKRQYLFTTIVLWCTYFFSIYLLRYNAYIFLFLLRGKMMYSNFQCVKWCTGHLSPTPHLFQPHPNHNVQSLSVNTSCNIIIHYMKFMYTYTLAQQHQHNVYMSVRIVFEHLGNFLVPPPPPQKKKKTKKTLQINCNNVYMIM